MGLEEERELSRDVLISTDHHVVAGASEGAFGIAFEGAFKGWSQNRHPRRQA